MHGADDFLPVLMYVLARSNMAALLLDVEYMMELMDPALQLGEGEDTHTLDTYINRETILIVCTKSGEKQKEKGGSAKHLFLGAFYFC